MPVSTDMNQSGYLHRYFLNNSSKRLHKWVHYFDIYERHFSRFRGKSPVFLEIGVFGGGSLAMWKDYFGEGSKIIGIDINPDCKQHESEGVKIYTGSQDDPALIGEVLKDFPSIDIVLDDGSHVMRHMIATFNLLYGKINSAGLYMVEDTHTCYWDEYEGGLSKPDTFIEFTKRKFDELNAFHTRGEVEISEFTRSTDFIALYDSVVVFEKKPQGMRQAPITGPMGMQP